MARGKKTGGRGKGVRNKATIEREAAARAALKAEAEREAALAVGNAEERLMAAGVKAADSAAQIVQASPRLMKDIAFDFARLWAGMSAFHQPYPSSHQAVDADGKLMVDRAGRPVMVNDNPNFDEAKFMKYGLLATQTALGAAKYQSPSLSAVMVGQQIVHEIEITGGLPDEEDGGLAHAAENAVRDAARIAGPGPDAGAGGAPDVPPEAGGAIPTEGEAQGRPLRKAVG